MSTANDMPPLSGRRDMLLSGAGVLASWSSMGTHAAATPATPPPPLPPAAEPTDVRSMGAVGDGKTDDARAIQQALDRGGRVVIPPGRYRIGAALKLRHAGTVIEGVSAGTTTIVGDFDGASMIGNADIGRTLLWCRIGGIGIVANGRVRAVVDWRSMQFGEIARCWIYGSDGVDQAGVECGVKAYGAQECTFNRFQDNYVGNVRHGYRAGDGANANHITGGRAQLEGEGAVGATFAATETNGINGWTIVGFCCEHPGNTMTGLRFGANVWDMYVAGNRFEQLGTAIEIEPGAQRITLVGNAYSSNARNVVQRSDADARHLLLDAGAAAAAPAGSFDGSNGRTAFARGATVRRAGVGSYIVTLTPPMPSTAYGVLVSSDAPATRHRVISPAQFAISTMAGDGTPRDAGPGVTFSIIR